MDDARAASEPGPIERLIGAASGRAGAQAVFAPPVSGAMADPVGYIEVTDQGTTRSATPVAHWDVRGTRGGELQILRGPWGIRLFRYPASASDSSET